MQIKRIKQVSPQSHQINPSITPSRPALMPATSFWPEAELFLVALGVAPEPVAVAVAPERNGPADCPTVGSLTLPSTFHTLGVEEGQGGGVLVAG